MQDIHDIRPPVQVGFDPMLFKIVLMVLGGIFVSAGLFFLIKKWLKKRKQPKDLKYLSEPMAPYEAALKELEFLFQKEMVDPRLFYFDLTAVLRQYIGRSYTINAIEMTSQEFVNHINRLDFDKAVKRDIARFFKLSDPFKYAGTVPEKDRVKEDLLFIKEKIHQIEKDLIKLKEKEEEAQ
ncbi:hypothetical protein [Desulfobacula sp.]|uniref:hypothetical protein n=1 Tax=Desulfobacula sp. TaxID=2593537 RepID=UPI0025BFB1CC|nr:hypothetical protein [Desulfobacula sp.]MBC2704621.1 hypothetical protein [Desulfobacula sp.]